MRFVVCHSKRKLSSISFNVIRYFQCSIAFCILYCVLISQSISLGILFDFTPNNMNNRHRIKITIHNESVSLRVHVCMCMCLCVAKFCNSNNQCNAISWIEIECFKYITKNLHKLLMFTHFVIHKNKDVLLSTRCDDEMKHFFRSLFFFFFIFFGFSFNFLNDEAKEEEDEKNKSICS